MNDVQVNTIDFNKKIVVKALKHLCLYILSNPIKIILFTAAIVSVHFLTYFFSIGYASLIFVMLSCYIALLLAEENKTNQIFPITIPVFVKFFNQIFWTRTTITLTVIFFVLFNAPLIFETEQVFAEKFELGKYNYTCLLTLIFINILKLFFFSVKENFLDEESWKEIGEHAGNLLFSLGLKGYIISCLGRTTENEQDEILFDAYIKNGSVIQKYQMLMLSLLFVICLLIELFLPVFISSFCLPIIPLFIGFYQREIFYEMFDAGTKEKETKKSEELSGQLVEV